jgi:protein ImuA
VSVSVFPQAFKALSASDRPSGDHPITFGADTIDAAMNGGLARCGVHEIFASSSVHLGAATGFAVILAARASGTRPVFWVRQDVFDVEAGGLSGSGLSELGLDPQRIVLVRARDAKGALRAAEQAVRCAALGAVVIEPWGEPKILDFKASRRLSLASTQSGVPIVLHRAAARPSHSAAMTRWSIEAAPSRALEANAPGFPAFVLTLLRQRGAAAGRTFHVEWDRDRKCLRSRQRSDAAALSRPVVSIPADRPAETGATSQKFLKAG